jgi:RHS repeat-associated protein
MPGRKYVPSNPYRFGYQGQFAEDETEETGYNSFEARLYDARIGRWTTIDPAGQFYSPYLGMGNNPLLGIDPDGERNIPLNTVLGYYGYESREEQLFKVSTYQSTVNIVKLAFGLIDPTSPPELAAVEYFHNTMSNRQEMNYYKSASEAPYNRLTSFHENLKEVENLLTSKISELQQIIDELTEDNSTGIHAEEIKSQSKAKWEYEYQLVPIVTELKKVEEALANPKPQK